MTRGPFRRLGDFLERKITEAQTCPDCGGAAAVSLSTDTQAGSVESEVEQCRCGRAMYRHGRKTSAGRKWSCGDLAAFETRERFTVRYMQTPAWRRWLLRTPAGWRPKVDA